MAKIDPYINLDAGTMGPFEHGEVFVTDDGAETDLDIGNYERFTGKPCSGKQSITTGQIYNSVINKERQGSYLGKCVQVVPHVTDEIKRRIHQVANVHTDVVLIELGGTVGDLESTPFLEAAREMIIDVGKEAAFFLHITLIPQITPSGEFKSKPTQHSVQKLREAGIQPDFLVCRSSKRAPGSAKEKIAAFTQVPKEAIIDSIDCQHSIYELPLAYKAQNLDTTLLKCLGLPCKETNLQEWKDLEEKIRHPKGQVTIGMVGKYANFRDAYLSVYEALTHGGYSHNLEVKIQFIDANAVKEEALSKVDGILLPGGFGARGFEGKIFSATYAKEHQIPFLGICLGMQAMVVSHARHALGYKDAHSTEFDAETPHPFVHLMESQREITKKGGSMRLGTYRSDVVPATRLSRIYGKGEINERHRHRYEVNNAYSHGLAQSGLQINCITDKTLIEGVEWPDHPFGIDVQFHPEFKSQPYKPAPLYYAFIGAAHKYQKKKKKIS